MSAPDSQETEPPAKVLLMADNKKELYALQLLLGADDYQVLTAVSAAECFELLALHEVQVIVCNERIPDVARTDFLGRIRELHPSTLQIVLSGSTDFDTLVSMINCGGLYRYLRKPSNGQELRDSVRGALRSYRLQLQDAAEAPRSTASARTPREPQRQIRGL